MRKGSDVEDQLIQTGTDEAGVGRGLNRQVCAEQVFHLELRMHISSIVAPLGPLGVSHPL